MGAREQLRSQADRLAARGGVGAAALAEAAREVARTGTDADVDSAIAMIMTEVADQSRGD